MYSRLQNCMVIPHDELGHNSKINTTRCIVANLTCLNITGCLSAHYFTINSLYDTHLYLLREKSQKNLAGTSSVGFEPVNLREFNSLALPTPISASLSTGFQYSLYSGKNCRLDNGRSWVRIRILAGPRLLLDFSLNKLITASCD